MGAAQRVHCPGMDVMVGEDVYERGEAEYIFVVPCRAKVAEDTREGIMLTCVDGDGRAAGIFLPADDAASLVNAIAAVFE